MENWSVIDQLLVDQYSYPFRGSASRPFGPRHGGALNAGQAWILGSSRMNGIEAFALKDDPDAGDLLMDYLFSSSSLFEF